MSQNPHPTRSPEFLSRLHDGDLSPAERAHFESHRAHCAECRHAASEFEDALSLYRSSRPAPAAPDLSARILRKLQGGQRRRVTFGPSFGIDLRWAGAFAAAVIAVIVGFSVVGSHEATERSIRAARPIPLVVSSRAEGPEALKPSPEMNPAPAPPLLSRRPEGALQQRVAAARAPAPESKGEELRKTLSENADASVAREEKKRPERERDNAVASDRLDAARNVAKFAGHSEAPAAQAAQAASAGKAAEPSASRESGTVAAAPARERAGGQGANATTPEASGGPLRVRLESLDGIAGVPAVAGPEALDLPTSLRGSRYIVSIDTAGRVLHARPEPSASLRKDPATEAGVSAPGPVLALRFVPGDRPRRLLVSLE